MFPAMYARESAFAARWIRCFIHTGALARCRGEHNGRGNRLNGFQFCAYFQAPGVKLRCELESNTPEEGPSVFCLINSFITWRFS